MPHASWRVAEGATVLGAHRPERCFAAASMVKTFVLVAALEAVEEGKLDLDAPVAVASDLRCAGDGVLRDLLVPEGLPLRDLLRLMVVLSDNTATNAVLAACGGLDPVNARFARWGVATRVRSWVGAVRPGWAGGAGIEADPDLPTPAGLAVTSPLEHAALLDDLLDGRRLGPLAPLAFDLLAAQQDRRALARSIGEDVRFAHKTGTLGAVRHDAGVLLFEDGRRVSVAAFTDGGPLAEWPDHPACVGMALAMAWTAEVLGLDVSPPPGVPRVPAVLAAPAALADPDALWSADLLVEGTAAGSVTVDPLDGTGLACVHVDASGEAAEAGRGLAGTAARARGASRVRWS